MARAAPFDIPSASSMVSTTESKPFRSWDDPVRQRLPAIHPDWVIPGLAECYGVGRLAGCRGMITSIVPPVPSLPTTRFCAPPVPSDE